MLNSDSIPSYLFINVSPPRSHTVGGGEHPGVKKFSTATFLHVGQPRLHPPALRWSDTQAGSWGLIGEAEVIHVEICLATPQSLAVEILSRLPT